MPVFEIRNMSDEELLKKIESNQHQLVMLYTKRDNPFQDESEINFSEELNKLCEQKDACVDEALFRGLVYVKNDCVIRV